MSAPTNAAEASASQDIVNFRSACDNLLQNYSLAQSRLNDAELKIQEQRQYRTWNTRELFSLQLCVRAFLVDSKSWNLVVYGSHAVNHYLPAWLWRKPSDYDVFVIGTRKDVDDFLKWAVVYFRGHYPDRAVSVRKSLHNPQQSSTIVIGAQCALDVTQSDEWVPYGAAPSGEDAAYGASPSGDGAGAAYGASPSGQGASAGSLKYASLAWVVANLQHVLTLDAAAYRHEQDRHSLRRLCYAQCLQQLEHTTQRISAELLQTYCKELFEQSQKQQSARQTQQLDQSLRDAQDSVAQLTLKLGDAQDSIEQLEQSLTDAQTYTTQLEARLASVETRRASADSQLVAVTQSRDAAIQKLQARIRELESRAASATPKKRSKKRGDTRKVDNTTRMIEMFRQSDEAVAENLKLQDTIDKHKKALANALKTLRELTEEQKQTQSEIRDLREAQREKADAFAILFRKQAQLEFLAQEQRREIEQLRSAGKAAQARFTLSPNPEPTLNLSRSTAASQPKVEVRMADGSNIETLQMCKDCHAIYKHCSMDDLRWRIYTNSNEEELPILSLVGRSDGEESACQRCLLKSYMSDRSSS